MGIFGAVTNALVILRLMSEQLSVRITNAMIKCSGYDNMSLMLANRIQYSPTHLCECTVYATVVNRSVYENRFLAWNRLDLCPKLQNTARGVTLFQSYLLQIHHCDDLKRHNASNVEIILVV